MGTRSIAPDLKDELVAALNFAVVETFRVQSATKVTLALNEKNEMRKLFPVSLAAEITLMARYYQMDLALVFPESVVLGAFGKVLGQTLTEMSPEAREFPLEVANIVLGVTKEMLNKKGHSIGMARPRVLPIEELVRKRKLQTIQTYHSEMGSFFLCLCQGVQE